MCSVTIHMPLSLLFPSGDNILTALNVARTCGMTSSHEQIIFVHASPPTANSRALLRFHQGDGAPAVVSTQETMDILEQVLIQDFIYFIAFKAVNNISISMYCFLYSTQFSAIPCIILIGLQKHCIFLKSFSLFHRACTRTILSIIWL